MKVLKPCPHCGGIKLSTPDVRKIGNLYDDLYEASIFCLNVVECGAGMEVVDVSKQAALDRLARQWNRRANNGQAI